MQIGTVTGAQLYDAVRLLSHHDGVAAELAICLVEIDFDMEFFVGVDT